MLRLKSVLSHCDIVFMAKVLAPYRQTYDPRAKEKRKDEFQAAS